MIARIPHSSGPITLEAVSEANPGWKVEREADGSFTMSPTGTMSGLHDTRVLAILLEWQKRAGGVLFGSSTGFEMPDKSVLSPDATWISDERWNAVPGEQRIGYAPIVPDVCIEVVSKTDRPDYLVAKLQRYRRYGAGYVLLIDPWRRTTWSEGAMPLDFPSDFTSVFDAGTA
jgi:Uma2 family endonuclease